MQTHKDFIILTMYKTSSIYKLIHSTSQSNLTYNVLSNDS